MGYTPMPMPIPIYIPTHHSSGDHSGDELSPTGDLVFAIACYAMLSFMAWMILDLMLGSERRGSFTMLLILSALWPVTIPTVILVALVRRIIADWSRP